MTVCYLPITWNSQHYDLFGTLRTTYEVKIMQTVGASFKKSNFCVLAISNCFELRECILYLLMSKNH